MIKTYARLGRETKILHHIADTLSEQNKQEAKILFGDISIGRLLQEQAENTESGFVLFDGNGDPKGVGGIFKNHTIWFVLAEDTTMHMRVSWLKNGRRWFDAQLEKYRTIHGYCWSKNTLSMKWMRWFGFDFAPEDSEATARINNETFLYFQKTK